MFSDTCYDRLKNIKILRDEDNTFSEVDYTQSKFSELRNSKFRVIIKKDLNKLKVLFLKKLEAILHVHYLLIVGDPSRLHKVKASYFLEYMDLTYAYLKIFHKINSFVDNIFNESLHVHNGRYSDPNFIYYSKKVW